MKISENQLVIYKTGSLNLQSLVGSNGLIEWTNKTVNEYLKEKGPGYVCITFKEAFKQIEAIENKELLPVHWHEITQEKWFEMFEVLPPEKLKTVKGIFFFRMSEYFVGNITNHFARVTTTEGKERFFEANRRITDSYDKLAIEILSQYF